MSGKELRLRREPCSSCPYSTTTPSGVWHRDEYDKLVAYDGETWEQPTAVFLCHHSNAGPNTVCQGWVACHGEDLLALRLAAATGQLRWEELNFDSPDIHPSGQAAKEAGVAEVDQPGEEAQQLIDRLTEKLHLR